ncbi:hypothetical protein FQ085_05925 [Planococcus sp. ANT_H30]|uniref:membrane lipoprotein lipid attachment site-containing protein n=2 Tax=Planococcus TaxID=1372 RepID=UPI0011ED68E5|nr:membrane lipoprotein lipid attachment site-containing protein [Planococcus sp. ANT_H30]KAA0957594.1 hypothetical protein FQ085_05925 [Planococcus sp. ANT_H30]
MRKLIVIFLLLFILAGCAEKEFESSEVIENFPIPAEANPIESEATNPNIVAFQKYRYSNNNEPQGISKEYLAAIEDEGWSELEEEQMGATRFFSNGERKVAIEALPDSISLYEYKE